MYIQHLMIFRTFAPAFQKRITDKKGKFSIEVQKSEGVSGLIIYT